MCVCVLLFSKRSCNELNVRGPEKPPYPDAIPQSTLISSPLGVNQGSSPGSSVLSWTEGRKIKIKCFNPIPFTCSAFHLHTQTHTHLRLLSVPSLSLFSFILSIHLHPPPPSLCRSSTCVCDWRTEYITAAGSLALPCLCVHCRASP